MLLLIKMMIMLMTVMMMMTILMTITDDHSRVSLKIIDGDPNSDYINACTVNVSGAGVFWW